MLGLLSRSTLDFFALDCKKHDQRARVDSDCHLQMAGQARTVRDPAKYADTLRCVHHDGDEVAAISSPESPLDTCSRCPGLPFGTEGDGTRTCDTLLEGHCDGVNRDNGSLIGAASVRTMSGHAGMPWRSHHERPHTFGQGFHDDGPPDSSRESGKRQDVGKTGPPLGRDGFLEMDSGGAICCDEPWDSRGTWRPTEQIPTLDRTWALEQPRVLGVDQKQWFGWRRRRRSDGPSGARSLQSSLQSARASRAKALLQILATVLLELLTLFPTSVTSIVALIWSAMLLTAVTADGAKGGGFRCDRSPVLACLPNEYSKFELPIKTGANPISISIDIDEVLRINDKDYSITFSCYFNVKWPEGRMRLSPGFGDEQARAMGANINTTNNPEIIVPMNLEMVKDLWLPNIFIYNLKTYKVLDVLNKLAGLWIGADHTILFSQATHITFICPMHFDKFPLDTQRCKFQVGSCSYDDTKMIFTTERAGYNAKTANSIALDYAIDINPLSESDSVFLGGSMGNFSLAGFEMVLHRYVSTYIITYYLPSGLFVIVSWISFLIPMDVIPGRMALLVTLFLVLVNIFNTVTTNTPKAEGLTAIEAWMLACILFVFGALIEYAAILFKKQRYVSAQNRMSIKIVCKDNFKYEVQDRVVPTLTAQQLAEEYWRIDKFFLVSFPVLFFVFNIIYWMAFIL